MRSQRRRDVEKEKQEKIQLGLEPPPPPKGVLVVLQRCISDCCIGGMRLSIHWTVCIGRMHLSIHWTVCIGGMHLLLLENQKINDVIF